MRADSDLLQDRRDDAFLILNQGRENVDRQQFRIAVLRRELIGSLDGFLRFYSEFVPTDRHKVVLLFLTLSGAMFSVSLRVTIIKRIIVRNGEAVATSRRKPSSYARLARTGASGPT